MRGSWWPNLTAIFWPPLLWPSTLCLFRSPVCSTGGPEAHSAGWWLSLLHLISNFYGPQLIGGPKDPFGLMWLSLPHLISNFSGPQLIRSPKGPFGLMRLSLPHLVYNSVLQLSDFLSWPSYTIVQRPLNRLLDLWNGMFDRHQAEITVMQFRGHSLLVRQSMRVSWDFLPCPISSAKHSHAISFDYWPLECVTSFRCIIL